MSFRAYMRSCRLRVSASEDRLAVSMSFIWKTERAKEGGVTSSKYSEARMSEAKWSLRAIPCKFSHEDPDNAQSYIFSIHLPDMRLESLHTKTTEYEP